MSPLRRWWSLALTALLVTACTSRAEQGRDTTSASTTPRMQATTLVESTTTTVPSGPPSYLVYGWDGVTRVEGGVATRLTIEPVAWATEDGAGGVVYRTVTEEPGWVWLPAATDPPIEVFAGDKGWFGVEMVALVEGRPSLVLSRSWDEMVWCKPEDFVEEVLVVDPETGAERFVGCRAYGSDGGSIWTSYGGGLFSLVDWGAAGGFGSDHRIRFLDLSGQEVAVEHNPFSESCAPCDLDAQLSPDGSLLAYSYWPAAYWQQSEPSDGDYTRAIREWQEESKDIPVELVVLDLKTGVERWRTEVPAQTTLAGFDGRYLSTGRTIYDTVTGEVYVVPPTPTEPTAFWVAILDSLDTATHSYADAQEHAVEVAEEHGVATGVLWSDGWLTLNPGYWAVFTGGYPTTAEAAAACVELRPLVGSCYPRYVATADTIDPKVGLGLIGLRADGLGLVRFGDPVDQTVVALVAVLGPPTTDDIEIGPFINYLPYGFGADNYFRFVRWERPDLWVAFSDSDHPGESASFIGWGYRGSGAGMELVTPEAIGVGSTADELSAVFGDALIISSDEFGVHWRLANGLGGELSDDPADPASRVTTIWGGTQSTG